MSVLGRKWVIKNTNKEKDTFFKILENRGITNLEEKAELHDPFLFNEMRNAVSRIKKAITDNERIMIFGDYDVDGITGTAILFHILKKIKANVSYRLPNRVDDGYGLSGKFIDIFAEKEVKLLITVDCGISNHSAISEAKKKGIDSIITDHHAIPEKMSEAFAVLHPKCKNSSYPFNGLTGAGVAFKLAQALIIENFSKEEHEELIESIIDLASLGTVADIGPLKGENHLIVKKGLKRLKKTKWIGLKKIMKMAAIDENSEIDCSTIGFRIAPRINAAGRIGDPYLALSLLLQEEENEQVNALGNKLEELNDLRREMTKLALLEAEKRISTSRNLPYILIAESPDWHVGILGLIAGKLAEKYTRPSIIMQDFGDTLVGSARSNGFFNIIEAISAHDKYLISFGGHAQAAGFSIKKENLENFKKELSAYTEQKLKGIELKATIAIDCEIKKGEIGFDLLEKLEKLKPFGVDSENPTFLIKDVEPSQINQVGKEKNHLKFNVSLHESEIRVIAFKLGEFSETLREHKKIDLVCNLSRNKWNGRDYIELHALDFRESKT